MSIVVSGSNASRIFYDGEIVSDVEAKDRASLYVSGGAYVSGAVVRTSSYLYVFDHGVVSSLVLSAGTGRISGGGVLGGADLSARSFLLVSSGGTATGLNVSSNGNINVDVYADDAATVIAGSNSKGAFSLANGVASNFILYSRGAQAVHSGALTSDITVGKGAYLYVSSGGRALGVVQETGGLIHVAVSGGDMATVVSGSNARGNFYLSGGTADNFQITNGGMQNVYSGGVAVHTLASGLMAQVTVFTGGTISSATIAANASLTLHGNADAKNIEILAGGNMEAHNGGLVSGAAIWGNAVFTSATGSGDDPLGQGSSGTTNQSPCEISDMSIGNTGAVSFNKNVVLKDSISIAGALTVVDGVTASAQSGCVIDLNISGLSAGNATLINGLSRISGDPGYTLTVSDKQKIGKFFLADGAADFNRTITVKNETGNNIGTLDVGGELNYGEHYTYSLEKSDGALTLTVSVTGILPPAAPVASADITAVTNQNVTVTAVFGDDAELRQYSLDNTNWRTYESGVVMSANGTVYFRGLNYLDFVSEVTSFSVTNIDKVAPDAPTVAASTTAPTNQNVTVTATYSADSSKKQYSTDNSSWQDYTSALTVSANGTYYFRGIDAAGNISPVTSIDITNIDKEVPSAPSVTASTTAPTNQNVTVTATYSAASAKKQYSTDNKSWQDYTSALTVSANGTYYFRGVSAAGSISEVTSIEIANIDKVAPDAPTVAASTTAPTNQNVTVTATYSADSAKKQYSTDNKNWKDYTAALTAGANGTWYFRGIDAAGNISEVASVEVANIDKIAPAAPTVKANTTAPTNQDVTLTATYSADSSKSSIRPTTAAGRITPRRLRSAPTALITSAGSTRRAMFRR